MVQARDIQNRTAVRHVEVGTAPLLDTALPEFEKTLIRVALARSSGRRQDAAKVLGWGRNTLTRKMRELGMETAGAHDDL